MTRFETLFNQLSEKNEAVFAPFVLLGDPSLEQSLAIVDVLVENGADVLILGIPFSEPIADGPVGQEAVLRAFESGITPTRCFEAIAKIRQKYSNLPIGLHMYANLVFANGTEAFYQKCAKVGVDSVLVLDVPMQEAEPFCLAAQKHNIAPVFMCPSNANEQLVKDIAKYGIGYTCLVAQVGETGMIPQEHTDLEKLLVNLKTHHAPPVMQGFNISSTTQLKVLFDCGIAGAIFDSCVAQIVAENLTNTNQMLVKIADFVKDIKQIEQK